MSLTAVFSHLGLAVSRAAPAASRWPRIQALSSARSAHFDAASGPKDNSWTRHYQANLCAAVDAVKLIKSGDRVVFGHSAAEPHDLVNALVARAPELRHVEIVHMSQASLAEAEYTKEQHVASFHHNSLFVSAPTRPSMLACHSDYTPVHFHEVPSLFTDGLLPVDVTLVNLSPPDRHGFCSFGTSVDYTKPAAHAAKLLIAQVNPNMPRTHGESFIHISEVDRIVESSHPIQELHPAKVGSVERDIGRHVAALVQNGDCLQLGIGGIPDAVLSFLGDKADLGIHSEMFSDGVLDLYNRGIINNTRKNIHREYMVATFLVGSRRLYDFVNDNPSVQLFSVDHVNDPAVIGSIDNMVSINSALAVDLTGQVVADTIGYQQFSGIGGQVDFVRGAARSRNGRAIIALPSTAKNGTMSRIVSCHAEGSAITTMRADVDFIVTEYGAARLRGKTVRQRAHALIDIAHPDFRKQLIDECNKSGRCWFQCS